MSGTKELIVKWVAQTDDFNKKNERATEGVKKTTETLDKSSKVSEALQNTLKSLGKELLVASGLFYTASQVAGKFFDTMNLNKQLGVTSDVININAQELSDWGQVLEHVGGNTQSFIKNLEAIHSFYHIRKDEAIKFLWDLSAQFQKLNPRQAMIAGQTIGFDENFVYILRQGPEAIKKLLEAQHELNPATDANYHSFKLLNDAMIDSKNAAKGLFTEFGILSQPTLTGFFNLAEWGLVGLRKGLEKANSILSWDDVILIAKAFNFDKPIHDVQWLISLVKELKALLHIDYSAMFENAAKNSSQYTTTKQITEGFLNLALNPLNTQTSSTISNSSSAVSNNYTQNVTVQEVKANDKADFMRQMGAKAGFSPSYINSTWSTFNQSASGVK